MSRVRSGMSDNNLGGCYAPAPILGVIDQYKDRRRINQMDFPPDLKQLQPLARMMNSFHNSAPLPWLDALGCHDFITPGRISEKRAFLGRAAAGILFDDESGRSGAVRANRLEGACHVR